jgi:hypothetical protein
VLRNLIYGLIVIVLIMFVVDMIGRRRQQQRQSVRKTRRPSRAADDAPLSAWGSAMNPRADFPPTVFDEDDDKPRTEHRSNGGQTPAAVMIGLSQRRAARNTFGVPDTEVVSARMTGTDEPVHLRHRLPPVEDPLERSARPRQAPVANAFNSVRLLSLSGPDQGKFFPVVAAGTLVGRHPSCQIVVGDRRVSGRHAWLGIALGKVILRDLDSTNGTLLNNGPGRVIGETEIRAGDTIYLGGHKGVQFQLLID